MKTKILESDIQKQILSLFSCYGFVLVKPQRKTKTVREVRTWRAHRDIVKLAGNPRGFLWRQNTGQIGHLGFGVPGASDIQGITSDGKFIAVEIKRPGKRPTPEQQAFLDLVNDMGGIGVWFDGIESVRSFARDMGWVK